MKKLPFLLLALILSACAAPSVTETAPESARISLPTAAALTPFPAPAALSPTAAPTQGFPTFTPPTAQPGKPIEIRFPPNGTYLDLPDSIPAGGSKTYALNAMKGQIMSVSVLPQADAAGSIAMQIKGADGGVLCPKSADEQCLFWRDALPASQNYFITLASDGGGMQYVMRVAINPLNVEFQYFEFKSDMGFSLTYPDAFAPAPPVPGNYKTQPVLTLQLIETALYEKTNLSEVYLMFSASADPQVAAACAEPNQNGGGGPEYPVGEEVYNGINYVHTATEGAGAGNLYRQEIYRAVNGDTCYEIIYYIHSTNIGNYPPEANVTEFNLDAVLQYLQAALSTLEIQ